MSNPRAGELRSPATRIPLGSRIPSLDGIRAVSFLMVFAAHSGVRSVLGGNLLDFADLAFFGVTVFFFLSGFLITTLLRVEYERKGHVNVRHFWLRRALRILPPFYLIVLLANGIALVLYPPGALSVPTTMAEILFYANYWGIYRDFHDQTGMGVVWSLAVEEHFYLLFPLFYVALQKGRVPPSRQAALLWGLCALILAWRILLVVGMHAMNPRIFLGTDTRIDSILFGCALAVWNNPVLDRPTSSPSLWKYCYFPATVVVILMTILIQDDVFKRTVYFSIQGVALTVIFIAAVRFPNWPVFRFLNLRPVVFMGTLSYSLYLIHSVFLGAMHNLYPQWHAWQRAVIALAASLFVAYLVYELVDRPCASLRRKLTD
jgi:peptidoglycan/LPS O-acetylase OafA/YrhL